MGALITGYAAANEPQKGKVCALTTGDSASFTLGTLESTDVLEVVLNFRMVANDASTNVFTIRIDDGAVKDFSITVVSNGVNFVYTAHAIIGDGRQTINADWNHSAAVGNSLYSESAITMNAVSAVEVINAAGGGTALINGISVSRLQV
jgi:hypothetical protein